MMKHIAMCAALVVGACAPQTPSAPEPPSLGQFRLGHNIAIAEDAERGPISRQFSETELESSLQNAVAARLRRYDGDGLYHLVMRIDGITLAEPGIPVIYAAKPALLIEVDVFDNDTRQRLNSSPERILATGTASGPFAILGSGNVRSAEEQLAALSADAAEQIGEWLSAQADWFAVQEDQVRVPYDTTTQVPDLAPPEPVNQPEPAF